MFCSCLDVTDEAQREIDTLPAGRPSSSFHPSAARQGLLSHQGLFKDAVPYLEEANEASMEALPAVIVTIGGLLPTTLASTTTRSELIQQAVKEMPNNPEVWHRAPVAFYGERISLRP